jgi:hypothetical protein
MLIRGSVRYHPVTLSEAKNLTTSVYVRSLAMLGMTLEEWAPRDKERRFPNRRRRLGSRRSLKAHVRSAGQPFGYRRGTSLGGRFPLRIAPATET